MLRPILRFIGNRGYPLQEFRSRFLDVSDLKSSLSDSEMIPTILFDPRGMPPRPWFAVLSLH